ncbi:Imidazolonepropionase-like amidohydrolase OS=Castellaniella defragrans OX=75697 GN=HNR28_001581 PE=4 SV=1 [Castellaniella defragrans]
MSTILFTDAQVLDTEGGRLLPDHHVLVVDDRIKEVTDEPIRTQADRTVAMAGRILMPGLCDSHVHVTAMTADFSALKRQSPFYVSVQATQILRAMLLRGFTTVRDAGGADYGLARAAAEGRIEGPTLHYCGHALSQTGGHGDVRSLGEEQTDQCFCCAGLGVICDGVPEVRRAARHEIRRGATHIKIMASGGVASPADRIDSTQFSLEEIDAVVEEANAANIYVMAHAYTARAVNRLLPRGVRTIEHGNLIDQESCRLFREHEAFLTPTLATYDALAREGIEAGLPPDQQRKVHTVLEAGSVALELAQREGVRMLFGTDLLGTMHRHQLNEFHLRKDIVPAADLIRSATCNAAEAFLRKGEFGVVAPGSRADLLVLDQDPLADINVLADPERHLKAVMKDGKFYKDEL